MEPEGRSNIYPPNPNMPPPVHSPQDPNHSYGAYHPEGNYQNNYDPISSRHLRARLARIFGSRPTNATTESEVGYSNAGSSWFRPWKSDDNSFKERHPFLWRYRLWFAVGFAILLLLVIVLLLALTLGRNHVEEESSTSRNQCSDCEDANRNGFYLNGFGDAIPFAAAADLTCGASENTPYLVNMNLDQFGKFDDPWESPACGKCIEITGPQGVVRAKIVGVCPTCDRGDITLSPTAFSIVAPGGNAQVPVSWRGCP